ncbi:hypothetical protein AVHM3334_14465 [Acidovorax sp. SUPP3334]|nr:hypothetical protein AVHM3334_14465 [Acidovorax sp. SUPP3334]
MQFVLCHRHAEVPGRLDDAQYPMLRLSDDVLQPVSAAGTAGRPLHAIGQGSGPLPLLAYSDASGLGRIMRARMRGLHGDGGESAVPGSVAVVFTAHHAVLLKTMALEGRGVAWLPRSLIADELRAGTLVAAGESAWDVPVEIRMCRQRAEMSPVAESLWSLAVGQHVKTTQ